MTFLPKDYEVPESGNGYMRLEQGENKFRILSAHPIIGTEVWVAQKDGSKKPVRIRTDEEIPRDIICEGAPKHFWAMVVWNYKKNLVQILQLTQKSILGAVSGLIKNEDWGDPHAYDIIINRKGEGLETEYSVMPTPKKDLAKEVVEQWQELESKIKLEALYEGEDPFSS